MYVYFGRRVQSCISESFLYSVFSQTCHRISECKHVVTWCAVLHENLVGRRQLQWEPPPVNVYTQHAQICHSADAMLSSQACCQRPEQNMQD